MKLLPPRELNNKIQEQKKSEIDAGLFLAKKVDSLREHLAETIKEHDEKVNKLQKEFEDFSGGMSAKKDNLVREVEKLEVKRKELLKPLKKEWDELKKDKVDFIKEKEEFSSKRQIVLQLEEILTDKEIKLKKLSNEIEQEKDTIARLTYQAVTEAEEINKKLHEIEVLKSNKEMELHHKESALESKENNLVEREETMKKERLEFNKEKKLLELKKKRIDATSIHR